MAKKLITTVILSIGLIVFAGCAGNKPAAEQSRNAADIKGDAIKLADGADSYFNTHDLTNTKADDLAAQARIYSDGFKKLTSETESLQKKTNYDPSLDGILEFVRNAGNSLSNFAGALGQNPMQNHEGFLAMRSALNTWELFSDKLNAMRASKNSNYGWWKKPVWAKDPFYN